MMEIILKKIAILYNKGEKFFQKAYSGFLSIKHNLSTEDQSSKCKDNRSNSSSHFVDPILLIQKFM